MDVRWLCMFLRRLRSRKRLLYLVCSMVCVFLGVLFLMVWLTARQARLAVSGQIAFTASATYSQEEFHIGVNGIHDQTLRLLQQGSFSTNLSRSPDGNYLT